jgi:hypothetical protein
MASVEGSDFPFSVKNDSELTTVVRERHVGYSSCPCSLSLSLIVSKLGLSGGLGSKQVELAKFTLLVHFQ